MNENEMFLDSIRREHFAHMSEAKEGMQREKINDKQMNE